MIIRQLCRGGYSDFSGEFYQIESLKLCPVPDQSIPLLIGGHSDAALKRAAQYGDGWLHGGGEIDELDPLLAKLKIYLKEFGRENDNFQIHAISYDAYTADGIKRMEDKGITDAIIGFHNTYSKEKDQSSLDDKLRQIDFFANTVIARSR